MAKKTADAPAPETAPVDTTPATQTDNAPPTTPTTPATPARPANMPTRCRMVEYTDEDGETIAAVVTQVKGDELHLGIFHPLFGYNMQCLHIANDHRDKAGEAPRTWNWPARQ